jgi:hypothetical protein
MDTRCEQFEQHQSNLLQTYILSMSSTGLLFGHRLFINMPFSHMAPEGTHRLHWTQRVALVRHNLHSARRTNDFSFFKTLQAHALIEGTDHVAILYSSLGDNQPLSDRHSSLRADISQQRDMADLAIDKTANSAINFIQAQPSHCQEAVANAWVTGTTIIADAVCVCLNEMKQLENGCDDFIRLEYS